MLTLCLTASKEHTVSYYENAFATTGKIYLSTETLNSVLKRLKSNNLIFRHVCSILHISTHSFLVILEPV